MSSTNSPRRRKTVIRFAARRRAFYLQRIQQTKNPARRLSLAADLLRAVLAKADPARVDAAIEQLIQLSDQHVEESTS